MQDVEPYKGVARLDEVHGHAAEGQLDGGTWLGWG